MIEDLCRYSFSSVQNLPLFSLVKTLMHKNFIPQKNYETVLRTIKGFVGKVKEKLPGL